MYMYVYMCYMYYSVLPSQCAHVHVYVLVLVSHVFFSTYYVQFDVGLGVWPKV